MEEFFRFWRRIPRFLFGLSTVLVLAASLLGTTRISDFLVEMPRGATDTIGKLTSSVVFAIALLSVGSVGVFLLEVAASGIEGALHWIAERPWAERPLKRLRLHAALLPIPALAIAYYKAQRSTILEFFRLRSRATPGHDLTPDELTALYEEVGTHLDGISDPELLTGFGYWTNVTQDQVKLENRALEIREIYYFLFFVISLLVLVFRLHVETRIWAVLSFLFVASVLIAVPMVRNRKQELAIMYIIAYCDNFAVAQGATIEDRAEF